ncbi:hypothetical protein QP194_24495, partial [Escherichia coli]|nr:hypothetical protein [Escherichia coli]
YGLPKATVHANNRKLSEGFSRGVGLTDIEGVLREIDKLDKIGADEVSRLLQEECGASADQAAACLQLAELSAANGSELREKFDALCEAQGVDKDGEAYALA